MKKYCLGIQRTWFLLSLLYIVLNAFGDVTQSFPITLAGFRFEFQSPLVGS